MIDGAADVGIPIVGDAQYRCILSINSSTCLPERCLHRISYPGQESNLQHKLSGRVRQFESRTKRSLQLSENQQSFATPGEVAIFTCIILFLLPIHCLQQSVRELEMSKDSKENSSLEQIG